MKVLRPVELPLVEWYPLPFPAVVATDGGSLANIAESEPAVAERGRLVGMFILGKGGSGLGTNPA